MSVKIKFEYQKGQAQGASLLPTLRLNHDVPDEALGHQNKRRKQFKDAEEGDSEIKGSW